MQNHNKSALNEIVEIAGAGLAGLAAAITLAHAGRQVVVHEIHDKVGYRFNGDFQGLENWTDKEDVLQILKKSGFTTDFNAIPCHDGTIFDPSNKSYKIKSDKPLFYLIERGPGQGTFDKALLDQALSLGVDVRFKSHLQRMRGHGILAAGPRAADAIAVGYHFDTDMSDGYWVICDDRLAPKGYAYLLVMNGRGTVKSCMFSDFRNEKLYVKRTVEAFRKLVGMEMKNPKPHGGYGNFRIPKSAYSGSHPLVGEQAGFQDTLWGFGMRLAIFSGVLAAKSLLTGKNYDTLWKKELKAQMEASVVNRALYSLVNNRFYGYFLTLVASRKNLRESMRKGYRSSLFKKMLYPWANRRYESRRKDISCTHLDCHCIWCRSGYCDKKNDICGQNVFSEG